MALRDAIRDGSIFWSKHVLQRLVERGVRQHQVLNVVSSGECIQIYPDDEPYPSALFLGWLEERPFHVVAAYSRTKHCTFIVTAYQPTLEYFEPDFKTRRKP